METGIFQSLEMLGLTSKQSRIVFNERTRDADKLNVWKDTSSGVIYIDEFYTGDETYIEGSYREDNVSELKAGCPDVENALDARRRLESSLSLVTGKKIADFGCGSGDFLKLVQPYCAEVLGVELQQSFVEELNAIGIPCTSDLDSIEDGSLDCVVSFHVIEHLPHPLETLSALMNKIVSGGYIVIEVPHANDLLLSTVKCEEFKQFTLWSQHLVLHTRESLRKMLSFVGLEAVQVKGVQRYPISNHLHWLANGKAGGHKSILSSLDSDVLFDAYQNSLARIDATDTLVAIAKVP